MLLVGLVTAGLVSVAHAGPREQARRIHDRLAGVPPTDALLASMEADVDPFQNNNPLAAAYTAMDNPNFYNVTLKNFAAPWTNRDRSVFVPLNDYIATVIGMIRDEIPFNTLLSADILYVGASGLPISGYSPSSNQHYADMESQSLDLSSPAVLQQRVQSSLPGSVPAPATAGVLTSRAAAEAFFIAGTNRAMFRFTMLNHMCNDMEQVHDVKRPPDRIRQDVSRSPGGDSRLFLNNCIGCHSGMDPMAGAFAYYNYNDATGNIEYTNGVVQPKYFNNEDNFPFGYVTTDDSWLNYWREGQNQFLGWDPGLPGTGNGAKSLGIEFGNSDAFANCQVKKVFKTVCLREPEDQNDRNQVATMVGTFRAGNTYSMKRAFADAAVYCMGQ
jgi:ribosome modulation factor